MSGLTMSRSAMKVALKEYHSRIRNNNTISAEALGLQTTEQSKELFKSINVCIDGKDYNLATECKRLVALIQKIEATPRLERKDLTAQKNQQSKLIDKIVTKAVANLSPALLSAMDSVINLHVYGSEKERIQAASILFAEMGYTLTSEQTGKAAILLDKAITVKAGSSAQNMSGIIARTSINVSRKTIIRVLMAVEAHV